jgi:TRAP-type C4-dicarboxylate transport system permease small subunit
MSSTELGDGDSGRRRPDLWIQRILEGLAALTLLTLMAMTCVDVIGRYFFNAPLDGATELTRLMMAVVVFAVMPAAAWREEHITVDLLDKVTPRRFVNPRQVAWNLIGAIAMAGIAYRIWFLAIRTYDYGDTTEFLEIPLYPITFFISVLSGVTAAALLLNGVRYLWGRGPLSPPRS